MAPPEKKQETIVVKSNTPPRTAHPKAVTMKDPAFKEQERKRHAMMRVGQAANELDAANRDDEATIQKEVDGIKGTEEITDEKVALEVINKMTDSDAILAATANDERKAIQEAVTRRLSELASL